MSTRALFLIVLLFNTVFLVALWHMSHNFMLRDNPIKQTKGALRIDRETAYRISEYIALAAFLATDIILILQVL